MGIIGWRYYNHAMIPDVAPHKEIDASIVKKSEFWRGYPSAFFARWTSNFDCGYETNWWYVIKDTPFDISSLKAKRRYEVNRGLKNFDVKVIDPKEYREELYIVQVAAFSAYPKKYRPTVEKNSFASDIDNWDRYIVFGAFFRETNELTGYALLSLENGDYVDFKVLKAKPEFEKYSVNAALVEGILSHFKPLLLDGGFICDGTRNVNHETAFQDYLEKYFGFRKAYCRLHIEYNPKIRAFVPIAYFFRKLFARFDGFSSVHKINAVLKMESLSREYKEK
ncbi:MAG: hypothetical protein IJ011_03825 [Clostridia bacterium]|nr:hypothetical protein [Clostridia bacterium]